MWGAVYQAASVLWVYAARRIRSAAAAAYFDEWLPLGVVRRGGWRLPFYLVNIHTSL